MSALPHYNGDGNMSWIPSLVYRSLFIWLLFVIVERSVTGCFDNNTTAECCRWPECTIGECMQCPLHYFLLENSTFYCDDRVNVSHKNASGKGTFCVRQCPTGFQPGSNGRINVCIECTRTGNECESQSVKSGHNINGTLSSENQDNDKMIISALVIGCITFIAVLCIVIYLYCRKRNRQKLNQMRNSSKDDILQTTDSNVPKSDVEADNIYENAESGNKDNYENVELNDNNIQIHGQSCDRYTKDPTTSKNCNEKQKQRTSRSYDYAIEPHITLEDYRNVDEENEGYEIYGSEKTESTEGIDDTSNVHNQAQNLEGYESYCTGTTSEGTEDDSSNDVNKSENLILVQSNNTSVKAAENVVVAKGNTMYVNSPANVNIVHAEHVYINCTEQ